MNVDLPLPFLPTTAMRSPVSKVRFTWDSASVFVPG